MQSDIVERAQRGDHDAFSELVQLDGDRCYAIAIGILRDRERAQDAVQQAFLMAWRDLPKLRDTTRFEPWLHRLLVRICYEEARRFRRWSGRVVTLPVDGPEELRQRDSTVSISDRDALERAFVGLSPEHRAVVLLHHHIGWTLPEVAEIVGVPLGTVKSRLFYATRSLRAAIEPAGTGDQSERMPA
jgi:RNA polymerase sigma-70 factor (ECF subfamily)